MSKLDLNDEGSHTQPNHIPKAWTCISASATRIKSLPYVAHSQLKPLLIMRLGIMNFRLSKLVILFTSANCVDLPFRLFMFFSDVFKMGLQRTIKTAPVLMAEAIVKSCLSTILDACESSNEHGLDLLNALLGNCADALYVHHQSILKTLLAQVFCPNITFFGANPVNA